MTKQLHQVGNQHQGASKQQNGHNHQQPHLGHGHGHGHVLQTVSSFTSFEKGFIRAVALDISAAGGDTKTIESVSKNTGKSATSDLSLDTIISDITQSTSPYAI